MPTLAGNLLDSPGNQPMLIRRPVQQDPDAESDQSLVPLIRFSGHVGSDIARFQSSLKAQALS